MMLELMDDNIIYREFYPFYDDLAYFLNIIYDYGEREIIVFRRYSENLPDNWLTTAVYDLLT